MNVRLCLVFAFAIAGICVASAFVSSDRPPSVPDNRPAVPATPPPQVPRLPTAFIPNLGQWDHDARYVARIGPMAMFLQERGWSFTLTEPPQPMANPLDRLAALDQPAQQPTRGVAVRMTFAGAGRPELVAEQRLPGVHHYFLGNDPAHWRSDVPLYAAVRYRGMHDGIDVRMREHQGHFEYDLLLAPLADLGAVEVDVEGIDGLHVDGDGALVMATALGPVRMPAPRTWEVGPGGEETALACSYVLRGAHRFGFATPPRQDGWALVVDPGLVWSTFLGGADADRAFATHVDVQGIVTVAGMSASIDYPTTPGVFAANLTGGFDAFVIRLSPAASILIYSTYVGGTDQDAAMDVSVDPLGVVTIVGNTFSTNFPVTPGAFDPTHSGSSADAFVTRFSANGASLVYSTFLGDANHDSANAVAVDAQGIATVVGVAGSAGFPTTPGAYDTTFNGSYSDGFVARLSASGSALVYSTFLGGSSFDLVLDVAIDALGVATVCGFTGSTNFPLTSGAFDTTYNGGNGGDAFVTQFWPAGNGLAFSTFLGGANDDQAVAVAVDPSGVVTVCGSTSSANYPTTPGAFDNSFNGGTTTPSGYDAVVTRISPSGSSLVYSTFLGGAGDDRAYGLLLDAEGSAIVVGQTSSTAFPTTPGAFDQSRASDDGFVTRLSPDGSGIVYSTFLGGTAVDVARGIAGDGTGTIVVVGVTNSPDFPITPSTYQPNHNGADDAFVTILDLLPTGSARFGTSSPGCNGPVPISVNSQPRVGNTSFALTCGNAAPNSVGLIAFATSPLAAPLPVLGVDVWLDPLTLVATATTTANAIGASNVPLPIPTNPTIVNLRFFTQFLWLGPAAPSPCPALGFSASNALDVTIQP